MINRLAIFQTIRVCQTPFEVQYDDNNRAHAVSRESELRSLVSHENMLSKNTSQCKIPKKKIILRCVGF